MIWEYSLVKVYLCGYWLLYFVQKDQIRITLYIKLKKIYKDVLKL